MSGSKKKYNQVRRPTRRPTRRTNIISLPKELQAIPLPGVPQSSSGRQSPIPHTPPSIISPNRLSPRSKSKPIRQISYITPGIQHESASTSSLEVSRASSIASSLLSLLSTSEKTLGVEYKLDEPGLPTTNPPKEPHHKRLSPSQASPSVAETENLVLIGRDIQAKGRRSRLLSMVYNKRSPSDDTPTSSEIKDYPSTVWRQRRKPVLRVCLVILILITSLLGYGFYNCWLQN